METVFGSLRVDVNSATPYTDATKVEMFFQLGTSSMNSNVMSGV